MTVQDWAALTVSLLTIGGAFLAVTRWLVKHYLNELKPNSVDLESNAFNTGPATAANPATR